MRRGLPVLVLHGGAAGRRLPRATSERIRRSLRAICREAYSFLQSRSAVETVVFAVQRLEDDPLFNAGTGSSLQRDGVIRMSAAIMDGARHRFAGVLNIERIRYPILAAKALLSEPDRLLAGRGATQFARAQGFAVWNPVTPARLKQWKQKSQQPPTRGTVGAVALDGAGRLAAATSTGGKGFEMAGRVSDSGLPVGNFANHRVGISCTGLGEDIVDEGLAVRIAQGVNDGASLPRAFSLIFADLKRQRRHAGGIGLDWHGRVAWATTTPMLFAVAQTGNHQQESF